MRLFKKILPILLFVSLVLGMCSIFAPAAPAQAAVVWQKNANPVLNINLACEPYVMLDNGTYKMWYTQNTSTFSGFDDLITDMIGEGPDFIDHFQSRTLTSADYVQSIALIEYLLGTETDIDAVLHTADSAIYYSTSSDGITWSASTLCSMSGSGPGSTYGVGAPSVLKNTLGSYEMWYTGWDPNPTVIGNFLSDLNTRYLAFTTDQKNTLSNDLFIAKDSRKFFSDFKAYLDSDYDGIKDSGFDVLTNISLKIGLATSSNGIEWTSTACVFSDTPVTTWDKYGSFSPAVIKTGSTYEMWYSGLNLDYAALADLIGTNPDAVTFKNTLAGAIQLSIGKAGSTDGVNWTKITTDSTAFRPAASSGVVRGAISPAVLKTGATTCEMWYTDVNLPLNSTLDYIHSKIEFNTFISSVPPSIYYTTSTDSGITWSNAVSFLSKGTGTAWDNLGVGSPTLIQNGSNYELWYTGFSSNSNTLANNILDDAVLSTAINGSNTQIKIGRAYSTTTSEGGGGGGGGAPAPQNTPVILNGLTSSTPLKVNAAGLVEAASSVRTPDTKVEIDIAMGTKLLNSSGKPLNSLNIESVTPPSLPSGYAIVMAYNFSPEGATFSPPLTITFTYDPADLPAGVDEKDLIIAHWDGTQWLQRTAVIVNQENNTISFQIEHFSQYAIVVKTLVTTPISTTIATTVPTTTVVDPTTTSPITSASSTATTTVAISSTQATRNSTTGSSNASKGLPMPILIMVAIGVFILSVVATILLVRRRHN